MTTYETVIGLEVHVELSTRTKLFCGCANEFGAEPNTHVCPVCLGLPGSLPVLNRTVVEFALLLGVALNFDVPPSSIFHRKNYFYPDMPKDFQVSQFDEPICVDGWIDVAGERIGIERAHMEEDTGKTTHMGGGGRIHDADYSLVDYNRAGIPLLEIVSRPDMGSAEQARGYVSELRAILATIGISDVKMEEGSMRVDANVSLRANSTDALGTKVEIKNMNSLRSLGRAIDSEIERQSVMLDSEEVIIQETRHWDEVAGVTHGMRSKEGSSDYRYFPEPDLVPVAPTDEMRKVARESVPELPASKRERLISDWGIGPSDARILVDDRALCTYAEAAVAAGGSGKDVTNWCTGEILGYLNEQGSTPEALILRPEGLAELVALLADDTLSRSLAKDVLEECLATPVMPREVVERRGLAQMNDEGELAALVDEVLGRNEDAIAQWKAGDEKARKKKRGFLMGELMKTSGSKGNPKVLNQLLDERLGD
ncbi:MAG: Asp-tRNA(Asn)/Glu-tRNA(Gln) amidotransferase subunit GatB [Acidimicrobiia bacterium]|nr:Asp-tRNA(Asn)/Glu-tRNA(Gln) amidotransferase subunit GatB [Acidimicrobiia bacterium]